MNNINYICKNNGAFLGVDFHFENSFKGEQYLKRNASHEWTECGYCSECDMHLFYK